MVSDRRVVLGLEICEGGSGRVSDGSGDRSSDSSGDDNGSGSGRGGRGE